MEADDGSSDRDSRAKKRIVLRELKECRWRMRVIRAARILTSDQDPVIRESDELVRIVATIILVPILVYAWEPVKAQLGR